MPAASSGWTRPNQQAPAAGRTAATGLTADELRVEYATLLSWTIGLVIGILTELEQAGAKTLRAAARPQPATSRLWPSEARATSEFPRMTKDSNPRVGNAVPVPGGAEGLRPGNGGCHARRLPGGRAGAGS